jgi:hypothetical protein
LWEIVNRESGNYFIEPRIIDLRLSNPAKDRARTQQIQCPLIATTADALRILYRMNLPSTPLIFSPRAPRIRVNVFGRLLALATGISCLCPLVIAAVLIPNPNGMGTHTALGLPRCAFQQAWGIPCPSCGMTTSWAWFARGNLAASVWIQPMGAILAVAACVVLWASLYIAVTGRAAQYLLRYLPGGYIVLAFFILAVLAWIWKIEIQAHHLDGWR